MTGRARILLAALLAVALALCACGTVDVRVSGGSDRGIDDHAVGVAF